MYSVADDWVEPNIQYESCNLIYGPVTSGLSLDPPRQESQTSSPKSPKLDSEVYYLKVSLPPFSSLLPSSWVFHQLVQRHKEHASAWTLTECLSQLPTSAVCPAETRVPAREMKYGFLIIIFFRFFFFLGARGRPEYVGPSCIHFKAPQPFEKHIGLSF